MSIKSTKPRHILELTAQEKQKFLDSFDTVLSDCDGECLIWCLVKLKNSLNAKTNKQICK